MNVFECEHLSLSWGNKQVVVDLNVEFSQGELIAILGPNGAGKSTLVKAMMGLLKPSAGVIRKNPNLRYALLPQSSEIDKTFPMTVYDLVAMGAWNQVGVFKSYSKQIKQKIADAMERVGLKNHSHSLIGELSGGQFQRALFARLMVTDASVFVLDEPFAAIDAYTRDDLLCIIRDWHAEGRTVIAVLHDIDLAKANFNQCLLLSDTIRAWGSVDAVITPENLEKARQQRSF
ncbi:metal ABC transporter ATP-binding protein [Basilea psittacipulmonis]|uniref:ABC transporter domain-containing protein n=1 Tax=Basilea psittacipulmonis DSM 24701 TaxID=1072685 RepID=A0A077DAR6_9BURK|nr:metal ABC transporter ATP-binding protein [Basilea psittacipulmonis]AIL31995.1 hypothetical protein IX83_00450 [Basilea psittacipulmonis DSM 24701]